MKIINRWKMRRVFRSGGSLYESATAVSARKSSWMVVYLRARRGMTSIYNPPYRKENALREKRWARRKYFEELDG